MFQIFVVIGFVYLAIKFFGLAGGIDWGFNKIVASLCFVFATLSLFVFVIIESIVFLMLPIAFGLAAVDLLRACYCAETVN